MADIENNIITSTPPFETMEDGIEVLHGSMHVDGNLKVGQQLTANNINIVGTNNNTLFSVQNGNISFNSTTSFNKPVQFNNGQTEIGRAYNSAYVGSPTLHAKDLLVIGDSFMRIDSDKRLISADTFNMTLNKLNVNDLTSYKQTVTKLTAKSLDVTGEIICTDIKATDIDISNMLTIQTLKAANILSESSLSTKNLLVTGCATIRDSIIINKPCKRDTNGPALIANGGEIVANMGIVSHTGNNRFQTMKIMGSGKKHETCFIVDSEVDSQFNGDVTIQNSNLVLDKSNLVTDNVIVSNLNTTNSNGIQLTTNTGWDNYLNTMIQNEDEDEDYDCHHCHYNPCETVDNAISRNAKNYDSLHLQVKSIINPIQYMMCNSNNIPKKFSVKSGIYRLDSNGNGLFKNIVSQNGTFSKVDIYELNAAKINLECAELTSVASNVVHTDNLLKSDGIAEFGGSVHSSADIFIEEGSNVNVSNNANVTFNDGSSLLIENGSSLEVGDKCSVKMTGDVELNLNRLVFVDQNTGNRYRIAFKEVNGCCGRTETIMEYYKVNDEQPTKKVIETSRAANKLDEKLKNLGL